MDFESFVEWSGEYPGILSCQNGVDIGYSLPSEFGGTRGSISPEDAFLGSANVCFQIVFVRIAESLGIDVLEYRSRAVGKLDVVDGARKFVRIDIEAEVKLSSPCADSRIQKVVDATKRGCLVTNSMDLDIAVKVITA
ncbi:MAG: OsmC family protein [Methanobacteriota archaeon]|nr:MAG: OsmC family protein [Euryarchaeota archaeon]